MNGDSWDEVEDAALKDALARGLSWGATAALLPGRTVGACSSRGLYLRELGVEVKHRDRAAGGGRGSGPGRPPNKTAMLYPSFRLHADTREAFLSLVDELGTKPGQLLREALERVVAGDASPLSERGQGQAVDLGDTRIAVQWGVPKTLLLNAKKAYVEGTSAGAVAEDAVIDMLKAHGYKTTLTASTPTGL